MIKKIIFTIIMIFLFSSFLYAYDDRIKTLYLIRGDGTRISLNLNKCALAYDDKIFDIICLDDSINIEIINDHEKIKEKISIDKLIDSEINNKDLIIKD